MPTLRQECMESLTIEIQECFQVTELNNPTIEDIYNEVMDNIDQHDENFWSVMYPYDALTHADILELMVVCLNTGLLQMNNGVASVPDTDESKDRLLKHYYKTIFIHEKDWVYAKIQEELNAE